MKYVFYGLVGLIALVVGAAAIGPAFVDWNAYKDDIAREVRAATGRSLIIDGDINLAVLPSPRLFVSRVRLRPDEGAAAADMVRLEALRLDVMLMPLLRGEVQVASMTLNEPVITVSIGKDGRTNWDTDKRAVDGEKLPPSPSTPEASLPGSSADPQGTRIRLDNMRIRNGGFVYRDARTGVERRFEGLDAEMSAATLFGPYDIKAAVEAQGVPVSIRAKIGAVAGRPSAPIELLATVAGQPDSGLEFKGRLVSPATAPRVVGKIKGRSGDIGAILARTDGGKDAKRGSETWAGIPFDLDAELDATPAAVSLNDLAIMLGDMRVGGGVSAALGTKPEIDVTLRARRLDADKLRRLFGPAGEATETASAKPKKQTAREDAPDVLLPKNLGGSIELAVESLTYGKRDFKRLRVEATLADGALKIGKASMAMPGGARASVAGRVTSGKTGPKFAGKLNFKADNLRAVFAWLGLDMSAISRDRLRKVALTAKLTADPKFIRIADMDAKLDGSIVKGGANYALRTRPAFGASLAMNVLNLDGYLAPAEPAKKRGKPVGAAATRKKTAAKDSEKPVLAALNDFDANFSISLGQLTYRKTPVRGIRAKASLLRGKLTIEKASVRSLGGARVNMAGAVTGFDKVPVFKGNIGAEAKNVVGLMRLAGLKPTADVVKLGGMKLDAKADIVAEEMRLDAKLDLAGGKASLDGKLVNYRTKPSLDFNVAGRHPDLPRFAALFGVEMPGAKARSKALDVKGTIKGTPEKMALNTELAAFGGLATVVGTVSSPGDGAKLDLAIQTGHPDFAALMRDLAAYRPKGGKAIGPASLRATVKGKTEKLALSDVRATIGTAIVTGDGEVRLGGKRPVLMAKLTAGDLFLDPLMPADKKKSGNEGAKGKAGKTPGRAKKQGRYSREPFDVAMLDALDGTISLNAGSLSHGNIRIVKPTFSVVIKDRVLTLAKAQGRVFKGAFNLTGSLDGRGVPAINGKLAVKGAHVDKALLQTAELDFASGILDLNMALNGAGKSEHDLMSALKGNAAIKARDGVIKGFDLPAVSKRLKDINRSTDVLSLLSAGMGGGSTRFSRLTGTFKVDKGIAHTKNLTLVADGGTGRSKGSANLAAWTVDLLTTFVLTEHAKAPPFTMRTVGPLDEPRQVFKFNKLQKFLVRRSMSRFIKKVLPHARQPAPANGRPAPKAQPKRKKKPKAEDILRGLLQGLEKR